MDTQGKEKPVVLSAENYTKKNIFKFSYVNPKILGILTVFLLMIGGVGTGVYLIQSPKQSVTQAFPADVNLSFQPATKEVNDVTGFSIDVTANANGNQITGVNMTINFDPAVLTLISINPKQLLPKVLIEPKIASGSATVSLGTEGNSGVTGSGILASLFFQPKSDVTTTTEVSFKTGITQVNVLGNPSSVVTDLGTAQVKIDTSNQSDTPSQATSSASINTTKTASDSGSPTAQTDSPVNTVFDFNDDGQINSIDLSLVYSAWGTPETDTQKKADINGDGVVNGLDYSQFLPKMKR